MNLASPEHDGLNHAQHPCCVQRRSQAKEKHKLCKGQDCCFHTSKVGARAPACQARGQKFEMCMFCSHEALSAVEADLKGRKLVEALRRLQASDLAIYQAALDKIEALRDKDTAIAYAQRAAKAKARNQKSGGQKQPDWGPLLVWRQPAMHLPKADQEAFQEDKSKAKQRLERKFPSVYKENARPERDWMGPLAQALRDWALDKSWRMCRQCGRMVPQPLRAQHLRGSDRTEPSLQACRYCKKGEGYWAPCPAERPEELRDLTPAILEALRPLEVHTGRQERARHGYLVHSEMIRFIFKAHSVSEQMEWLPKKARRRARKAHTFLLQSEDSSYRQFYELHEKFLRRRGNEIAKGDLQADAPIKRLPVNFLETKGLECCLWPHLYWRTDMCETHVRSTDKRRLQRRFMAKKNAKEEHDEEEDKDSSESEADPAKPTHQSAKASFLAKVHGSLVGYGSDPTLLHFVWDLWMWSGIGGAKNASGIGIREALATKPFSPEVWRTYHMALVDLQKQVGWPSLFITISPYEWSFPDHRFLEDELNKNLALRLDAPVLETLHIAHTLTQTVKGLLVGANDGIQDQGEHLFAAKDGNGKRTMVSWVARLEFQDGKRKRGVGNKPPQFYHGSGRVHVHILIWLKDLQSIDLPNKVRADLPKDDEPELRDLVVGSQLDWQNSGWPRFDGDSIVDPEAGILRLHHPADAHEKHCRAYLPDTLAGLRCHVDVQSSNGKSMILKYCSSHRDASRVLN